MKLLVFQHIACEHPGSLRQWLTRDGIEWDAVNLDQGETIPPLAAYDALWVLGGPMDVWDIETCPWLVAEKAAIREWVTGLKKPYLGLCLGHQLLADALGGTCGPLKQAEIGILEVELTPEGRADPLFTGLPARQKCLQWHSVEVAQAPQGATILASSNVCRNQAMRIGTNAWSMQYHVEVEADTIANWNAVPAYHDALMASIGQDGYEDMANQAGANMRGFVTAAGRLYENFMNLARA